MATEVAFPQSTVDFALKKLKEQPLVQTSRPTVTRFVSYRCPFCPRIHKDRKKAQKHFFSCAGKAVGVALTGR